jgi:hypothetical protein
LETSLYYKPFARSDQRFAKTSNVKNQTKLAPVNLQNWWNLPRKVLY